VGTPLGSADINWFVTQLSDEQLWRRAAAGDGSSFGQLFERHSDAVYNHCFRRCASWSEAEDLTSMVFLEAWRKRQSTRFVGETILPWLLAVANNVIRSARRSKLRYQRFLSRLVRPDAQSAGTDELEARVDDERRMAVLLQQIRELRIEEQEVISLCDWSGLTYEEAASALNIPVGTVRSRLSRAHQHLRLAPDPNAPLSFDYAGLHHR
jgi:RNA polymerase sigma factor (sigma-70 family)